MTLSLAGCCGSGGAQQVWGRTGILNRTYEIAHSTGKGPELPITASYDTSKVATESVLGFGWDSSINSHLVVRSDGSGLDVYDGDGSLAGFTDNHDGTYSSGPGVFRGMQKSVVGGNTLYIESQQQDTYYVYDQSVGYRLRRIFDLNNNCHYFNYDSSTPKLLTQVDFASGQSAQFGYSSGLLTQVLVPGNRATYFTYDGVYGNLVKIIGPDLCETDFGYDGLHLMLRAEDPVGYSIYYVYDGAQRLKQFYLDPAVTYFNYASPGLQTGIIDGNGNPWQLNYRSGGGILQEVDPSTHVVNQNFDTNFDKTISQDRTGAVTYFGFDGGGNTIRQLDPRLNATYFGYDGHHHLLAKLNADGCYSYYAYDAAGNLLKQRNFRGYGTYFVYDSFGERTKMVDALNGTTYYGYDSRGMNIKVLDPQGDFTYFAYDDAGNKAIVNDALNNSAYFGYDKDDNKVRDMNARGYTEYFVYDGRGALTKDIDRAGYTTYMAYDAYRQLSAKRAPNALNTYYAYDGEGHRTVESNDLGSTVYSSYFKYDSVGWQVAQMDPRGNTTYFAHDANGRTTAQQDALLNTTYFAYDGNGNRVISVGPRWTESTLAKFTTYYGYDVMNRQSAIQDPLGRVTYFGYDCNGNQLRVLAPGVEPTYYAYDSLDRKITDFSPTGSATYYGYDADGNQIALQNPRLFTTYYHYDPLNRRDRVLDALFGVQYFVFDQVGNTIKQRDQDMNWTYFAYDAMNREVQRTDALLSQWQKQYDSMGNLVASLPSRGGASYYAYDRLSRQVASTDGLLNTTYFGYDAANNRTTVYSPRQYPTYFGYDALNRQNRSLNAIGGATYFRFDAAGNTIASQNPLQNTTYFAYDALNRNVIIEDALQNSVYFGYDQAGNQSVIEDALQHSTYFYYDLSNRLTASTDPLLNTAYWGYDLNSNLARSLDNNGQSVYFGYDALDRRTVILYCEDGYGTQAYGTTPYGGMAAEAQYFGYDPVGSLTAMQDGWGASYFSYDALNRLQKRVTPNTDAVYYAYDAVSNLTTLEYPGAANSCYYAYDNAQRMSQLQTAQVNGCYYAYDASSNVVRKELGNNVTSYMAYDGAERVTAIHYAKSNGTPVAYFDYAWDLGSRITKIQRYDTSAAYTSYYGYDNNDRLVSEIWQANGGAQTYGFFYNYDAAGNRLKERKESTAGTELTSSYYAYNADNSLQRRKTLTPTPTNVDTYFYYDPNGALSAEVEGTDATYFTYDANQLIRSIVPYNGPAYAWSFYYDGQLNRYRIDKGLLGTRYLLWDGLNCMEERDASNTLVVRYSYGATPIYGIGSCVEIYVPGATPPSSAVTYTLVMDHRGTASVLLDSNASVVGTRQYNAFGEIILTTGTWPVDLGYQTNWQTVQIGTKWWGLSAIRLYNFDTGVFIQRDPLGFPASNLYTYCGAQPNTLVDPYGLYIVSGPTAMIIRWISPLNVADVYSDLIAVAMSNYGPVLTLYELALLAQMASALSESLNPDPVNVYNRSSLDNLIDSKEFRSILRLDPAIQCCGGDLFSLSDGRILNPGYTPKIPLDGPFFGLRGFGAAESGPETGITATVEEECVVYSATVQSRLDPIANFFQALLLGGGLAPWIWSKIDYTLCCDGSYFITYTGSYFPSAKAYLNDSAVYHRTQTGLQQFLRSSGKNAPGAWSHYEGS